MDPIDDKFISDVEDHELVELAKLGKHTAIEALLKKHQTWIYNISLRMTGNPLDAEDVTQEILIKMMTKLSTFNGRSGFRTWLYRIMANHVLNMKRSNREVLFSSFEQHRALLDNAPDLDLDDGYDGKVEQHLLVEETKIQCMMGMLLCLDRKQRLSFILGAIFRVNSSLGSEILETSPENFRQELSRVRKQLGRYMNGKCSLLNKDGTCKCARKTKAAVMAGYVDPDHMRFIPEHVNRVKDIVSHRTSRIDAAMDKSVETLYGEHPFLKSPNFAQYLTSMLDRMEPPYQN